MKSKLMRSLLITRGYIKMNKKLMLCMVTALGVISSAHAVGNKRVCAPSPEEVSAEAARNFCERNDVASTIVVATEREFNAAWNVHERNMRLCVRTPLEPHDLVIVQVPYEYEDNEDGPDFKPTCALARIVGLSDPRGGYGLWNVFFGHNDEGEPIIESCAIDCIRVPVFPKPGDTPSQEDISVHEFNESNSFLKDEPVLVYVNNEARFGKFVTMSGDQLFVQYGASKFNAKLFSKEEVGKRPLPLPLSEVFSDLA